MATQQRSERKPALSERPVAPPRPEPKWTPEQLMAVRHMGPGIIGQEMHDAAEAYLKATGDGRFGPALLGVPGHNQAGPVKLVDGKPVFAHELAQASAESAE